MKVSVTKLENGGAVLVISGPGTKDVLDTADQLGINPQDYVIETLRHGLKLRQLAKEPKEPIKKEV